MAIPAVSASTVNPSQVKPTVDKSSDLYKVCLDFEALFIKQMLNVMRKTVEKQGLLDGGMSEDIFEDMLYDEYAKKMAQTAQFGLAETMYLQINHQK
jgi:peptidoglycan hydrolase FlgJ